MRSARTRIMKSSKAFARLGALAPHTLEIGASQREQDGRPVRGYSGGAHRAPEEAHLAHDRVRHDAPHAQAFPIALCDVDRKIAGGHEIDRVGRRALVIEDLRAIGVLALEIGGKIGGPDARTELMLKPPLEAGKADVSVEACLGEQSVLAPGQRDIEVGEGLVPAPAAEEAAATQATHDWPPTASSRRASCRAGRRSCATSRS